MDAREMELVGRAMEGPSMKVKDAVPFTTIDDITLYKCNCSVEKLLIGGFYDLYKEWEDEVRFCLISPARNLCAANLSDPKEAGQITWLILTLDIKLLTCCDIFPFKEALEFMQFMEHARNDLNKPFSSDHNQFLLDKIKRL